MDKEPGVLALGRDAVRVRYALGSAEPGAHGSDPASDASVLAPLLALTSPPLPQCFLRPFLKLFALGSLAQGLLVGETQPERSVPKLPSPHSQAGSCLSSSRPVPGRHGGSARGGRLVPASYLLCKLPWLGGWWAFPVPSLAFPPREPKRSLL